MKEAAGLQLEVRFDHVETAVEVVIANADSHARHLLSIATDGDSAHQAIFTKSAVMIVQKQQACGRVASHVEIGPAVIVHIEGDRCQTVGSTDGSDSRLFGDIGEGAVAVVAVEIVLRRFQSFGTACDSHALEVAIRHFQRRF